MRLTFASLCFLGSSLTAMPVAQAQVSAICTNAGTDYKVGEYACIAACHGQRRLARCDVIADRASWTYVSEACPSAMIVPAWPSDWSEIPALAAMSPRPVTVTMSAVSPMIATRISAAAKASSADDPVTN